jgi:hypothetical protein
MSTRTFGILRLRLQSIKLSKCSLTLPAVQSVRHREKKRNQTHKYIKDLQKRSWNRSHNKLVRSITTYGPMDRKFGPRQEQEFFSRHWLHYPPSSLWVDGSTDGTPPKGKVDHSFPLNAEFKIAWSHPPLPSTSLWRVWLGTQGTGSAVPLIFL